jgi:hypothetical protein
MEMAARFAHDAMRKPYFRLVVVAAPRLTVTAILLAIEAVCGKIR